MGKSAGGATVSDHYAALEKKGRKARPKGPVLPPDAVYLWNHFTLLHAARTGGGMGPNPITYAELDAYSRIAGAALVAWEVGAIRALDDAYLAAAAEK
jgi:hypothetical protein